MHINIEMYSNEAMVTDLLAWYHGNEHGRCSGLADNGDKLGEVRLKQNHLKMVRSDLRYFYLFLFIQYSHSAIFYQ